MNTTAAPGSIPNHLAWAIIATVFSLCLCCGIPGLFTGIAAIVFSSQVNSKLNAGDIAGAQSASNTAKILCWITTACAIIGLFWLAFSIATSGVGGLEESIRQGIEQAQRNR
ncbi:MAG: CD225/dispanin family protein [Lysobacter sp.]|nr:CD225/dispanin family protein [Lysobacter sp.]